MSGRPAKISATGALVSRQGHRGRSGALVFYTIPAAAREFEQSPKTVRRLVGQGLLPARRLGASVVLLKSDLERFFAALPVVTSVDGALARIAARVQTGDVPAGGSGA